MVRLDPAAIDVPGVEVRVVQSCGSTNAVLLKEFQRPALLAAEHQTAGRGRRGRRWRSAPGDGITFSLARTVRRPLREIAAVSLVAGVATARALRGLGAGVSLKWPNDLVVGPAKLGGILVETKGSQGAVLVVIGIGINVHGAPKLDRPVTDLASHIQVTSRGLVISKVATELMKALDLFESEGLDALRGEWEAMDAHAGRKLRVRMADGKVVTGISSGLAENGGLRLLTRSGMKAISSGRLVTARAA